VNPFALVGEAMDETQITCYSKLDIIILVSEIKKRKQNSNNL